jgi:glycosyltransferase involved in cell wall biosynthesis
LVLLTGVDYDFFRTEVPNAKADLGLGDGLILLHVGALMQKKNQILSIQALKILKKHLGSVKLVLVGDGPWRTILQNKAKQLDLEDDVVFLGNVSEDKLRAVYYACDVNLFPVKDQTWGLVPFEALVVGKPSIIGEGAGAAMVIGREKIGFLIKPDVEELTGSVLFVLEHPELVKTMVEKGRRFVLENLTWEKYAVEMLAVFRSVLERD